MIDVATVGSGSGLLAPVPRSHYLWLRDVPGQSSARLWLFNATDPRERLSLSHTRISMGHVHLAPTSSLISNRRSVLARICEDEVRQHDVLTASIGEEPAPGELLEQLEAHDVPAWSLPDPVRLFTPVVVRDDTSVERLPSAATAGASFVLLAAVDLLAAIAVDGGALDVEARERMPAKAVA